MLYWHTSSKGKALALKLQKAITDTLMLPDRGAKGIDENGRGAPVLKGTKMPMEKMYEANEVRTKNHFLTHTSEERSW